MRISHIVSGASQLASLGDGGGSAAILDDKDHGCVALIVWRMEGEERSPACEARAHLLASADRLQAALRDAEQLIADRWGYPADASSRASILADIRLALKQSEGRP